MLLLALCALTGCASAAQAARECPTDAWWWPGPAEIGVAIDNPIAWAVSLGVGPVALGVCVAVNQVKTAVKSPPAGAFLDAPITVAEWCQQPESAGDERCPVQPEEPNR